MRVVVLVSADGEWRAVKALLPTDPVQDLPLGEALEADIQGRRVLVMHGGWGRTAAAASTQYAIDRWQPDLLVNIGTCGGFRGKIENGTIILVERTVIYDIVEQMTDPDEAIRHYTSELDLGWLPAVLPSDVVRTSMVSADRDIVPGDIPMLAEKYGAIAADWESGAIAWVAQRNGRRVLILRGVSDLVGATGGEAYGDYGLFETRTRSIMTRLFEVLPAWLSAIEQTATPQRT